MRELENVIGYAAMMAESPRIDSSDFPDRMRNGEALPPSKDSLLVTLDEIQRIHARRVIEAVGGNKVKAAGVLGVSRATLYRLLGTSSPPASDGTEA